jgi:MerR family transcriptional regulator, heat shock protein HspR
MSSTTPPAGQGVYGITVAADLVGTGVQNLRLYEARGLVEPARTVRGTRRYSADDLVRLRRIKELLDAGLNLAGIAMVLGLESDNAQLQAEKGEHEWLASAQVRHRRPHAKAKPSNDKGPAA